MNFSFVKAIIWAILIFIGSAISGNDLNEIKLINIEGIDKIIHFIWYFILELFVLFGLNKKSNKINVFSIIVITNITIFYGALMEILQELIFTSRSADINDFVADFAGIFLALILFRKISKIAVLRRVF